MSVHIEGNVIEESDSVKYLGIHLSHNLLWDRHINFLKSKVSQGIGILFKFKNKLSTEIKMLIYQALVHSHLTYLPVIYASKTSSTLKSLQAAQNKALKTVFNLPLRHSTVSLYRDHATNILPIKGLYKRQIIVHVFKALRGMGSELLFTQNFYRTQRATRQAFDLNVVRCRLELTKQRIRYAGPTEFNLIPQHLREIMVLSTFKSRLKQFLIENVEILLTY